MSTTTLAQVSSPIGSSAHLQRGVVEVQHPLIAWHLAQLRSLSTPAAEFRQLVRRLTSLLVCEATKDLLTEPVTVETPLTTTEGARLSQRVGLVPILRAGLGMVDPVLDLIPTAEVWHLGLYRDEETATPVEYYRKFSNHRAVDIALILDPMLATGGSAIVTLAALHNWGVSQVKVVSLLAAEEGVRRVETEFPDAQIYVGQIDPELNDKKFIIPGLGDAGDRIFNTPDTEG
jgi:uracil phosphoribosyltransferase